MKETILTDDQYFSSLIQDIRAAKKTIHLEVYIFEEDEIGTAIAEALLYSLNKGVEIRLLFDGIGTRHSGDLRKIMNDAGIKIKIYHPLFWSLLTPPFRSDVFKNLLHFITHVNSRNHRKTCVIDNKIAYIGSANIVQYSYHLAEKQKWRDVTVKIEAVPLDELNYAFARAWDCISFKGRFKYFRTQSNPYFRLNYSWRKRRKLYKFLLRQIDHAKTRIYITNAYFVPRRFLLLKLRKASKRGIDVRIIIPKNPDVISISLLMSSFYYALLKAGAKIFHHDSGILHAKFIIIDQWFCVGSSNLNFRSFHYDLEADVAIETPSAQKHLEELFESFHSESKLIKIKDFSNRSLFEKIALNFLWKIRFLF